MKTRNYERMLKRKYGDSSVLCLDRQLAKNHPRQYLKVMFEMFKTCGTIVIMPTEKMLRLLLPVLLLFRRIYKYRIVYSVVGGWLPQVVVKDKRLGKKIRKLDAVYMETQAMVDAMSLFKNVAYMPQFFEAGATCSGSDSFSRSSVVPDFGMDIKLGTGVDARTLAHTASNAADAV